VGNDAAQASAGHMETHWMKTDQRGKVQTVCRDSTLIALALILGHRFETPVERHPMKDVPLKDWGGVSSSIPECGVMLAG
jgi:hypothetical protein